VNVICHSPGRADVENDSEQGVGQKFYNHGRGSNKMKKTAEYGYSEFVRMKKYN
jgi:hypothetical protein